MCAALLAAYVIGAATGAVFAYPRNTRSRREAEHRHGRTGDPLIALGETHVHPAATGSALLRVGEALGQPAWRGLRAGSLLRAPPGRSARAPALRARPSSACREARWSQRACTQPTETGRSPMSSAPGCARPRCCGAARRSSSRMWSGDPRAVGMLAGADSFVAAPIICQEQAVGLIHADPGAIGEPVTELDRDTLAAFAEGSATRSSGACSRSTARPRRARPRADAIDRGERHRARQPRGSHRLARAAHPGARRPRTVTACTACSRGASWRWSRCSPRGRRTPASPSGSSSPRTPSSPT